MKPPPALIDLRAAGAAARLSASARTAASCGGAPRSIAALRAHHRGAPPRRRRRRRAPTSSSLLLAARDEDGAPMTDGRAARRARDDARRRPRDHRHRALVGVRLHPRARRVRGAAPQASSTAPAATARLDPAARPPRVPRRGRSRRRCACGRSSPTSCARVQRPMTLGGYDIPVGALPHAVHLPARTAAPRSTRSPSASGPSASSAPRSIRTPGSRSAAASVAASAWRSRSTR